ncbi:hypothetical protein [Luteitalea sp.]
MTSEENTKPQLDPGPTQEERIKGALRDPAVPKLYGNGFVVRISSSDLSLILENSGNSVAVISMSYTLAKTLAQKLGTVVAELEARTGREMLTTDQVNTALQSAEFNHEPESN